MKTKLFDRVLDCYFCEKPIPEGKKLHRLGGDGDTKNQCHPCYKRVANAKSKLSLGRKRKLKRRVF